MKEKRQKTRQYLSIWLTSLLCVSFAGSLSTYGAEDLYLAVDGNRVMPEQLEDHVIEYQELGSLIHAKNLTIQEMLNDTEDTRAEYTEYRDYFQTEKNTAARKKKDAKDEGSADAYIEYASLEMVYQSSMKSYNKMIDQLDTSSSNKSRLNTEKQLTNAAQNLMISYQSVTQQKEHLETMESLYHARYEITLAQMQAGLATNQTVMTAYTQWLDAGVSLSSITDNQESIYQNLCLLLGMDETVRFNIQRIPSAEPDLILQMNLEENINTAIGNNIDLISARSTAGGTTSEINRKKRTVNELEEQLKTSMQQLYAEILQAKTSYDAVKTGYSSAQIIWNNAGNKYNMGMISKTDYLQEELNYIQKKVDFEAADLSLFQAMENYSWAVNGIVDLSGTT